MSGTIGDGLKVARVCWTSKRMPVGIAVSEVAVFWVQKSQKFSSDETIEHEEVCQKTERTDGAMFEKTIFEYRFDPFCL